MNTNIPYIETRGILKISAHENKIFNTILEHLKELPQESLINDNVEFIKLICNLVENMTNKDIKIKKELVIKIIRAIHLHLSEDNIKQLDSTIEFLFVNNQIKKLPYIKKLSYAFYAWVVKKFL
jgi:hypothetical protein